MDGVSNFWNIAKLRRPWVVEIAAVVTLFYFLWRYWIYGESAALNKFLSMIAHQISIDSKFPDFVPQYLSKELQQICFDDKGGKIIKRSNIRFMYESESSRG